MLAVALILATVLPGFAQATTKSLSTNFTLVNLSAAPAVGSIDYVKADGSAWKSPADSFNLPANGGQAIYRQYEDAGLSAGQGSAIVSSDQAVGSVVQILARGQNPTSSGAYVGVAQPDSKFYVPLVARRLTTASGQANSQIIVQNAGSADVSVNFQLIGSASYTKSGVVIKPGASYNYDLSLETNLPTNWVGSAVVQATTAGGLVAVVSNFFTGDALQTFNGFPSTAPTTKWFVPLFTSRLTNTLSTPVAVQNLNGAAIPIDGLTLTCTPGSGAPIVLHNKTAVANNAAYYFNPVTDTTIPASFAGSCVLDAGAAKVVVFVQMRFINTGEAAAYEGIPAGGTDKKLIIPLVAKRLGNGFATAVTIQNISNSNATATLVYKGANAGSPDVTLTNVTIPANGNLIQNQRTTSGVPELGNNWLGTLTVTSNQPINGFVQLTFLREINPNLPSGDNFMAHNAFTQP